MTSASTQIKRPASEVFRFVCDWRDFEGLWEKSIQILAPESLATTRLGQVTEYVHTSGKVVTHVVSTVIRFEEYRVIEWDVGFPKIIDAGRADSPPFPNVLITCELDEHEAMTQLKVSIKVHGRCPVMLKVFFILGLMFQRYAITRSLRTIKTKLESAPC
jgi:hypothetical protein